MEIRNNFKSENHSVWVPSKINIIFCLENTQGSMTSFSFFFLLSLFFFFPDILQLSALIFFISPLKSRSTINLVFLEKCQSTSYNLLTRTLAKSYPTAKKKMICYFPKLCIPLVIIILLKLMILIWKYGK